MAELRATRGEIIIIDDADLPLLSAIKWCIRPDGYAQGYVRGTGRGARKIKLHRVLMSLATGDKRNVDHINSCKLDDRRANLRFATGQQNHFNRSVNKHSKSGVKGVRWHPQSGRWQARITTDYKEMHLGLFETKDAAALAYNVAAEKHFGSFATHLSRS